MDRIDSQILVVGAGGAGLAAAAAASSNGAKVTIVDDNPSTGGQIWRRGVGSGKDQAEGMEADWRPGRVSFIPGTTVVDAVGDNALRAVSGTGMTELTYDRLIIATGARERFIPFPGWTLPNVFGAGGLQALAKGGLGVEGKRVVVAGTGPLLLAVAEFLVSRGAKVLFVAEQATFGKLSAFSAHLALFPSKLWEALNLRLNLRKVGIRTSTIVTEALGTEKLEAVRVSRNGREAVYECDYLAAGFHLVPNPELPRLLGIGCGEEGCEVDQFQRTVVKGVLAAGETTGIGGIELSLVEGEIAGHSATGNEKAAKRLFRARSRHRKFAELLGSTFELGEELRQIQNDETLVCRCEDVSFGVLKGFDNWRDAKLQTRCGMGPCQGRVCGTAAGFLFGWQPRSVRPPIFPVKAGHLVEESKL